MITARIRCLLTVVLGYALFVIILFVLNLNPVSAASTIRCVNSTGTGCGGACGSCFANVQAAINAAAFGDEILIANGVYAPGGTVADINKPITLTGAYSSDFSEFNPELYATVFDADWNGSVVIILSATSVHLRHLKMTHGNGNGNPCGAGTATGCGGGIYAADVDLFMDQCDVVDNHATTSGGALGGGIYADIPGHRLEIVESHIISNTASPSSTSGTQYGYGGGIYIHDGSIFLLQNEIRENVGSVIHSGSGGLHINEADKVEIINNTVLNNYACLGNYWCGGGGIYINSSDQVVINNNQIEGNWAAPGAGYGGGVYVSESDAHLDSNIIIRNTTGNITGYGGGVSILSTLPVTLSNNLIYQNISAGVGGGVSVVKHGAPSSEGLLVNNTIVDNGSTGVVASEYAIITLTNNIIAWHDTGLTTGGSGALIANTNIFWNTTDPFTGTNGIIVNPKLASNYRPMIGSPVVNQGLTIPWLTHDLLGKPRPEDGFYDIGAFEGEWWVQQLPVLLR